MRYDAPANFQSSLQRTTVAAVSPPTSTAAPQSIACEPSAKSPAQACWAPTAWPARPCSNASSVGERAQARKPPGAS